MNPSSRSSYFTIPGTLGGAVLGATAGLGMAVGSGVGVAARVGSTSKDAVAGGVLLGGCVSVLGFVPSLVLGAATGAGIGWGTAAALEPTFPDDKEDDDRWAA